MIIKIPPHLNYMYLAKCMCSRNCRAQRQWSRLQFKIQPLIIVVGKNTHPVIHQFYKGLRLCWLAYNSTTVLPRRPAVITSSTALMGSHTLPVNRNHRRVAAMTWPYVPKIAFGTYWLRLTIWRRGCYRIRVLSITLVIVMDVGYITRSIYMSVYSVMCDFISIIWRTSTCFFSCGCNVSWERVRVLHSSTLLYGINGPLCTATVGAWQRVAGASGNEWKEGCCCMVRVIVNYAPVTDKFYETWRRRVYVLLLRYCGRFLRRRRLGAAYRCANSWQAFRQLKYCY